jgi:hypothetical protein
MVKTKLSMNTYEVVERAVTAGVVYGYRRAFKHEDHPVESTIHEALCMAIMNELCEVVDFDNDEFGEQP